MLRYIPGLRGTPVTGRLVAAARGSVWTLAGYGASQVLKLISTLLLAHFLLDPKVFGLMALVNVFLSGLEVISDLGIGLDVVQHPRGEQPLFLDTAYLMQVVRGLLLCGMAVGLAIPFAAFYHQPQVRWLAIVGAFSVGIRGFASMSVWVVTRRLQLAQLTAVNVIGDAVGLAVSIVWALASPTAWALVAGKVGTAIAFVIASHVISDRLPRLRWDKAISKDILMFGAGMFLSSATYFFSGEAERLVVGKFATVAELGCFSLALSMAYAPQGVLQRIISNVFFPIIADSARQDTERAAKHFRKFRLVFLAASSVMAVGFITLSRPVVSLLLRPQYAATAWMLQLLGFRSALELFGSAAAGTLFALGVSRYAAIGNSTKLLFLGVGLGIAFTRYGLREALWVLALSPVAHYLPMLIGLRKRFATAMRTELTAFAVFIAIAVATALLYRRFA